MIQHEYVTMKLMNGDTIICVLISSDDNTYTIMYPIQMKTARIELEGKQKEIVTGTPWCSYTDDNIFEIYKQDVVILKPLNESTIQYYKNLIDNHSYVVENSKSDNHDVTINDLPSEYFFVKGNETIN